MVWEMGFFSDTKVIDPRAFAALRGEGSEVEVLSRSSAEIEDVIAKFVGTAGGSVTAGPTTTLQFALAAPTRSVVATRELARKMGIAPASP
jgi:hypothetical protein